jgi:hypothetical protein
MRIEYDDTAARLIRAAIYEAEASGGPDEFVVCRGDLRIRIRRVRTEDGVAYVHESCRAGSARAAGA